MIITVPALSQVNRIRHGFFGRNIGSETHGNHNCAYRAGDNAAEIDLNRAACSEALGRPLSHLVTVKQRHTADVIVADGPIAWQDAPVADAIVTATPGLCLGVLTADCVPVLFASTQGTVVAASHAGWRGAFDGVLENTVAKMGTLGAKPNDIVAAVGPCIGLASYEVGPEFLERFTARDAAFTRYFSNMQTNGHSYFDLATFAADRLKGAGVGHVAISGHDTCAEEALFFSFRRATLRREPDYGRQLSAIAIGS